MASVLFVDDDVLALQLMSKVMELLGHRAIVSSSPGRGLTLAEHEQPGLILVDMNMDEMDGVEFVRQLRTTPGTSHLPVLIFSAGNDCSDEKVAKEAGANGYIQKPVGLQELSKIIQFYTV